MSKSFQFGTHTQVGRSKQVNDNFSGSFQTPNGDLFIVCNGFGGNVSGATASKMVAESIKIFFQHQVYYNLKEALSQSLLFANAQIQSHEFQNPGFEGMSAGCVIVLIKGDDVFYSHVGDSRLYLMRNKAIRKLTKDHTFVQQLISQGAIDEIDAKTHPRKGEVNKSVGKLSGSEKLSESDVFRFEKGDVLLLSTPGLHGYLHDYDIEIILKIDEPAQSKADELIKAVTTADGLENATAIVIDFVEAKDLLIPVNILTDGAIVDEIKEVTLLSKSSNGPVMNEPLKGFDNGFTEEGTKINMPLNNAGRKSKGPDWALIILCVLFTIVLGLFFSGWDYMTSEPSTNELLNQQQTTEEKSVEEPSPKTIERKPANPKTEQEKTNDHNPGVKENPDKIIKKENVESRVVNYIVKSGDNLSKISEKFNIKKSTLKKLNSISDDEIKEGQELKIKVMAVHTIGPGDILSKLAKDYDVKKEAIKKANDMTGNKTTRGEKLIIPAREKQ